MKVKLCRSVFNEPSGQDEPGEVIAEAEGISDGAGGFRLLPGEFLLCPAGEKVWLVFPGDDNTLHAFHPENKGGYVIGARREDERATGDRRNP